MENAISISYYFIQKAKEKKKGEYKGEDTQITPLKLQKLLYFAQGIYLSRHNECLFDDPIEAWDYGPVVVRVWRYFRATGTASEDLIPKVSDEIIEEKVGEIGDKYKPFLNEFYDVYGKITAPDLVSYSHNHEIWQVAHRSMNRRITTDAIKNYFSSFKR